MAESLGLPQWRERRNVAALGGNSAAGPNQNRNIMKKLLALTAIIALSLGSADAGCGKKVTNEGTLKSFDAATKTLTVEGKDGKAATITLTPTTAGAEGVDKLVGKAVKVVSEHGKADSVAAGA
jgi:hypothetical protein